MSDCEICTSPMLLSVVSLAEQGSSPEEISEATGLHALAIEQHFSECCTLAAPTSERDTMEQSDRRLAQLSERISLAASVSGIQGDTRSHLSALSLALRVELEQRSAILARDTAERESPHDPSDISCTVAQIDAMIRHAAERGTIQNGLTPRCLTLLHEPAFKTIVQAVWARRELLPALLACCEVIPDQKDQTDGQEPTNATSRSLEELTAAVADASLTRNCAAEQLAHVEYLAAHTEKTN